MKPTGRLIGKELFWTVLLILFLWLSVQVVLPLYEIMRQEYSGLGYNLAMYLVPILFGMLLGLPSLLNRWNTHRGVNWTKLLIQGVPALVLATPMWLIMGICMTFLDQSVSLPGMPWQYMTDMAPRYYVITLAGVWFGKVLIDSIKVDRINSFEA